MRKKYTYIYAHKDHSYTCLQGLLYKDPEILSCNQLWQ